jgi:starvation-inducible DNA-binding protein
MERKQSSSTNSKARTRQDNQFATRIDLDESTREQMVSLLNQLLADLFDLFSQVKQAHWNVKGEEFYQLHKLFDEMAEELLDYIDIVAERVTALGGEARGTVRMAADASRVDQYPEGVFESLQLVDALADRYAAVAAPCREGIDAAEKAEDMVTSDLLIDVCRGLDKRLWFLEAHLQR